MTKKKLNREPKDAAAPAIEMVRHLVEQMRQQGQSDAEILAALDRLERDNRLLGALDVVLEQDLNREVEAGRTKSSNAIIRQQCFTISTIPHYTTAPNSSLQLVSNQRAITYPSLVVRHRVVATIERTVEPSGRLRMAWL
jgi:hypothetical protein